MDLTKYNDYLIRKYPESNTAKTYFTRIKNFFSKYNEFNQENVDKFLTDLCKDGKLSANNSYMSAFKCYEGYIDAELKYNAPTRIYSKPKQSLKRDEIELEILPYFPQLFSDYKKRAFVFRFMMLTMLRISEATNLKIKDIDWDKRIINVIKGKGGKHRQMPIHKSICDALRKYCNESKSEYALDVTNKYIEYIFTKINNELGYKKHLTPHSLRHSGARFWRKLLPIEDIQDYLGHSSLDTTKRYLGDDKEEKWKRFNKVKYKKGVIE